MRDTRIGDVVQLTGRTSKAFADCVVYRSKTKKRNENNVYICLFHTDFVSLAIRVLCWGNFPFPPFPHI